MQMTTLKLGTECKDKATGLTGTLTHWVMNMNRAITYVLQPKGLDDEGQPVSRLLLCAARLEVADSDFETVEVPFEVLGTKVTHKATGFKGMAVAFVFHINGCFHVEVQPAGTLKEKGTPIRAHDFDLRELTGRSIPKMTGDERKESKKHFPSPTPRPESRIPE